MVYLQINELQRQHVSLVLFFIHIKFHPGLDFSSLKELEMPKNTLATEYPDKKFLFFLGGGGEGSPDSVIEAGLIKLELSPSFP